jgi:Spy/CpxP family protein refolding chaperone
MARSLAPLLSLAALLAACSHNSPAAGPAMEPRASSSAANAAAHMDPNPGGPLRGDQLLLRDLALSESQQRQMNDIRARYRTQLNYARDDKSGDRGVIRDKVRALMDQQQTEMRAVLTPEQQVQFDKNMAEMRARRQPGGGSAAPAA